MVQAGIRRREELAAVAADAETGVACGRCGEGHHYAGARFCVSGQMKSTPKTDEIHPFATVSSPDRRILSAFNRR